MAAPKGVAQNPKGIGGFQDRPEDRAKGHWDSKNIFNYQVARFLSMTAQEFKAFAKTPDDVMTMAERTAYYRVANGKDLGEFKDMADRLQGKPQQFIDATTNGKDLPTPMLDITSLRDA